MLSRSHRRYDNSQGSFPSASCLFLYAYVITSYSIHYTKLYDIGYTINPDFSRKGYVTEVLKAYLPELQERFSDCEIIAMTEKENIPSKNLLLKLGFVYDEWIEKWQSEVYVYSK